MIRGIANLPWPGMLFMLSSSASYALHMTFNRRLLTE